MNTKQVFLSHSTNDVVLTRLIGHILELEGLSCFYSERDIPVGQEFDKKIIDRIHSCNVLLVIWTADAAASAWVNQEIGIAMAQDIPVWPLVIDNTAIQGAMFRRQGSLLAHDTDPYGAVARLALEIRKAAPDRPFAPHVDHFLIGKEQRTRELVAILRKENSQTKSSSYTLRIQAAFSCFAISADTAYSVGEYHTPEYHDLLVQERQGMEQILRWAEVRLIIWPQRPYDDAFMQVRFRNLLLFLRSNSNLDRLRVALGPHHGGNRYIFDQKLLVTGIKGPGSATPGYEFTTISYHGPTVGAAISEFDGQFGNIWEDQISACGSGDLRRIRAYVINRLEGMAPLGAQPDRTQ